ncbi:MAG: energy transducer TonB [Treponema sp.]|jgi:protein TonB|nr:energy transducer TonB [Treponema sp.]
MTNEKLIRTSIFIFAAVLHLLVLFFLVFKTNNVLQEGPENARVMKLTDFEELPPPEPELPQVEAIAETMIETETAPEQHVLGAGVFLAENYLPMHQVSVPPKFEASAVMSELVYPPIALRSGIEGRVILELFVDRTGVVQRIVILQENPLERGFGEAAVRAFTGRKGEPAYANGEAVSSRYRYPVTFKIK